jgi:hypothetical protein
LVACRICGSPGIEQVRGQLTEADKGWVAPSVPGRETSNAPVNGRDYRVTCSNPHFVIRDGDQVWQCNNATGWNKDEMADYVRFCWNRDNADEPKTAAARS